MPLQEQGGVVHCKFALVKIIECDVVSLRSGAMLKQSGFADLTWACDEQDGESVRQGADGFGECSLSVCHFVRLIWQWFPY